MASKLSRRGSAAGRAIIIGGALAMAVGMGVPAQAVPAMLKLHPVDGGHWQGQMGLPDAIGHANQALVRALPPDPCTPPDPCHVILADVTGLRGHPTSELTSLGFSFQDHESINPCIRVAFTDENGPGEIMLSHINSTDAGPGGVGGLGREPVAGHAGWFAYHSDPNVAFPPGTIQRITFGAHYFDTPPANTVLVMDNVMVNSQVWAQAGANGLGG